LLRLVRYKSCSANDVVRPHPDNAVTGKYEPEPLEKVEPSGFALESYEHTRC